MKDFAKSIVYNVKAEVAKVGNAVLSYEDKARIAKQRYLEAKSNKDYPEGVKYEERMAKDNINRLNEILQKIRTGKLDSRYEADEKDVEKAISIYKQIGNSKVGNGITKFGTGTKVIADGHEAIVLKETVEQGPNGIPFGWVEIKWTEGPWKGQTDTQYDYDLKKKVGNSKVGNFTISEGVKGKEELNTKYKNNLRIAKEALSRISRKISGYENASNINWGHLGDIARIADLLSEI